MKNFFNFAYSLSKHIIKKINLISFLFLASATNALFAQTIHSENFLVISDIHLNALYKHAMDVSPSKKSFLNDLDQKTFETLLADVHSAIQSGKVSQPDFVLVLGDIAGHFRLTTKNVINSETTVFKLLAKYFPGTPIFYTFGNNDSLERNYGFFKDMNKKVQYKNPYEIAKSTGVWKNGFLSTGKLCENKKNEFPCIITEDTSDGYYAAYLKSSLRLISLNTVLFSPNRSKQSESAATKQLQWLKTQLEAAKDNHESVLITTHIPPGSNIYDHSNFWLAEEQTQFLKLVKSYRNTIIGILAGHTHAEELKIIKDTSERNIAGIYIIPGLSTSHANEPAIQTFYFRKNNQFWELSDYETFHFSMTDSHLSLKKLFDYNHYYCSNHEDSLFDCLDNVTFDKIKKYYSTGNPNYTAKINSSADIVITIPD